MPAIVNHYQNLCRQGLQNKLCVDVYIFVSADNTKMYVPNIITTNPTWNLS